MKLFRNLISIHLLSDEMFSVIIFASRKQMFFCLKNLDNDVFISSFYHSNETFISLFIFQLKLEFLLLRVCGEFKFYDAVCEFPRFIISSVDVLMPIFFFCIFVSIKCLLGDEQTFEVCFDCRWIFVSFWRLANFHNLLSRPMLINVRRLSSLNCIFVSLSWNLWFSVLGFPSYYQEPNTMFI